MFDSLIKAIQDAVKPEIVEVNNKQFSTTNLVHLPNEKTAKTLTTSTLQSVIDYFENGIDLTDTAKTFVHIVSHDVVQICGFLNDDRAREIVLEAEYAKPNFNFGQQFDQESFITYLQTDFVDTKQRRDLQKLVGGLIDDSSVRLQDDGLSQQTTAKTGIVTVESVKIVNPVLLKPFRTFAEIEQPESPFILRLRRGKDTPPTIALFAADNSKWKLDATLKIKEFLADKVKVSIIA